MPGFHNWSMISQVTVAIYTNPVGIMHFVLGCDQEFRVEFKGQPTPIKPSVDPTKMPQILKTPDESAIPALSRVGGKGPENQSGRGTTSSTDRPIRSIVKAVSWRVTGTLDTIMVSYIMTRSIKAALSIGAAEVFTKMALYYGHERLWARIRFGRTTPQAPEYEI